MFSHLKPQNYTSLPLQKDNLIFFIVSASNIKNHYFEPCRPVLKLTPAVNFPTQIPDYDPHSLALLDFFLSSDAFICSTMAFPLLGNSDNVVSVSKLKTGCSVSS